MSSAKKPAKPTLQNLSNQLLIAMPELAGSDFSNAVIYLCDHSSEGAMGLIINKPLDIPLTNIFQQLAITSQKKNTTDSAFYGGPVNVDHGFVLHTKSALNWESTLDISEEVSLTTSKDIVEDIAQGKGPKHALIILGYAGWGAGQLEQEVIDNAWLTVPCQPQILFETPYSQQATLAASQAGIDLSKISSTVGHA